MQGQAVSHGAAPGAHGARADYLKSNCPSRPRSCSSLPAVVEKNKMPDSILRVTLTRGSGERGYSPKGADQPTLAITMCEAPPIDPESPALELGHLRAPAAGQRPLSSFKTPASSCKSRRAPKPRPGARTKRCSSTQQRSGRDRRRELFWIITTNLHHADGPGRCGHHPGRGAGNLPGAGAADEQTRHQTGGAQERGRHFSFAKRAGHGGRRESRRRTGSAIVAGGEDLPCYCEMLAKP